MKTKASEAQIQKSILDWLAAEHILAFRMNSGAVKSEHNGKQRFFRFGVKGMADVLAFPRNNRIVWANYDTSKECEVCWIEVKDEKGRQTEDQKSFQRQVQEYGHRYMLVRSLEEVKEVMGQTRRKA